MGKKQALGSTPTFENVAKATLTNDLFSEEELQEAHKQLEEENKKEQNQDEPKQEPGTKEEQNEEVDLYNDPTIREMIQKEREKNLKERHKTFTIDKALENVKKQELLKKKEISKAIEERIEEIEETSDKRNEALDVMLEPYKTKPTKEERLERIAQNKAKPNNKKHLRNGYTRQTYAVKDEYIELIKALALYIGKDQIDTLEALIERGLADIKEETKQEALRQLRKQKKETGLTTSDLFN